MTPDFSLSIIMSIACLQALHQLSYGGHIAVCVERVRGEAIGIMSGEHQLTLDIIRVPDRLQRLLNAVAARIGFPPRRARVVLRPVGELASAEATHAADLVGADLDGLLRSYKDQRRIRRAQRFGEPLGDPSLSRHFVLCRQINGAASWTNPEFRNVLTHRFDSVGYLVFRPL